MGLEAINFFFCSKEPIEKIIKDNPQIKSFSEKRYVYAKEGLFWIDLELQHEFCVSIRITLCNPIDHVLNALDSLFVFLFSFNGGVLNSLNTKEVFDAYDNRAKERIFEAYKNRKKTFNSIYGGYTSAIGSEEFYQIQRTSRGIEE